MWYPSLIDFQILSENWLKMGINIVDSTRWLNNKQPKKAWSQTGQVSLNDTIPKVPKIHQICSPFKVLKQEDQSEGQSRANPSSVRANLILKPLLSWRHPILAPSFTPVSRSEGTKRPRVLEETQPAVWIYCTFFLQIYCKFIANLSHTLTNLDLDAANILWLGPQWWICIGYV